MGTDLGAWFFSKWVVEMAKNTIYSIFSLDIQQHIG